MAIKLKRALPLMGVNLVAAPTALQEGECQWAKNVWPKQVESFSPRGSLEPLWRTQEGLEAGALTVFNAMMFRQEIAQSVALDGTVRKADRAIVFERSGSKLLVPYRQDSTALTSSDDVWAEAGRTLAGLHGRGCFVDIGNGAILFLDGVSPGAVISPGTLDFRFWQEGAVWDFPMSPIPAMGVASWGLLQTWEDGTVFATTEGDRARAGDPKGYVGGLPAGWRPRLAVMAHERLVYFNLADTHRDAMVWSDKNNPALIDAMPGSDGRWYANTTSALDIDGPYVRLGGDNQDITAAIAIATSNDQNLVEQSILAWKRDRVYLVQGEPGQTHEFGTNPEGSLSVKELTVRAGCVGASACCNSPYGVFWVGPDDVWFMAVGTLPMRVGTKISPRLKAQAVSDAWKIQCVYSGEGRLIVSLLSGGGGGPDASCDEQWWLDLRRGPPQGWQDARWFGPQVFTTSVDDFTTSGIQFLMKNEDTGTVEALVSYERTGDGALPGWDATSDIVACSMDGDSGVDSIFHVASPFPWVPSGEFAQRAVIDPPKYAGYTPGDLVFTVGNVARDFPIRALPLVASDEHLHRRYISDGNTVSPYLAGASPPAFGSTTASDNNVGWTRMDTLPVATPHQVRNNVVLIDVISREEALGDPAVMKNFDGIELVHDLNHPMVVDLISTGVGLHSITGRQTQGASGAAGQQAAGTSRVNQSLVLSPVMGTRFVPAAADGGRCPGFSHTFRFKTQSFIVLERTMFFFFRVLSHAFTGVRLTAQVPAGRYATVDDLITAINAAILAVMDPTWNFTLRFRRTIDGTTMIPFVFMEIATSGATASWLDACVPLKHRASAASTTGYFSFDAGPQVPPVAGFEAFDVYEDTTYLMSLLGFMVPPGATNENMRGVYLYYWTSTYPQESVVFANTPCRVTQAYPRFNIYDMNFRFKTFTKRPT